jgi:hypothetical protein
MVQKGPFQGIGELAKATAALEALPPEILQKTQTQKTAVETSFPRTRFQHEH